jgi:hypothetical protein
MLKLDIEELAKAIRGLWPKTPDEQIARHFKRFQPWELVDVVEAYGDAYDQQDRRDKSLPSVPAIAEKLKGKKANFYSGPQNNQDDGLMVFPDDHPHTKDPMTRKTIVKETGEVVEFKTMAELRARPEIVAWCEKRDREHAEMNKKRPQLLNFQTVGEISDTMGGSNA